MGGCVGPEAILGLLKDRKLAASVANRSSVSRLSSLENGHSID